MRQCRICKYYDSGIKCSGCEHDGDEFEKAEWAKNYEVRAYQQGAREFAEWLCRKSRFEEIDWSGIWNRDEDNKQEFFSIDEVLAEWQKGEE